ncbi:hypothetical protein Btru_065478 [Bulinus truncatus]|nr:hypothetical protein Btru_065478 [Bulinus truncatus]
MRTKIMVCILFYSQQSEQKLVALEPPRVVCRYISVVCGYTAVVFGYIGVVCRYIGVVFGYTGVVCRYIGVVCCYIGVVCGYIGVVCGYIGVVCGYIGVVCGYIGVVWLHYVFVVGIGDAKASYSTTCVDQSQMVQYLIKLLSNQSAELSNAPMISNYKKNYKQSRERLSAPVLHLQHFKNLIRIFKQHSILQSMVYNNKKYFVSKFQYQSATEAESYCSAIGGYLAEIDDQSEYKALQNFVLGLPVDLVLIGGSDSAVEGTWIFPRTGKSVPILDWIPGQPDNLGNEDCLNLWKTNGGKMNDLPCGFRSSEDRFMCETPVLDSP